MADIQAVNCCYSSKLQVIWINFCRALVTKYSLPPYQNLKQVNHLSSPGKSAILPPAPCCYAVMTSNIGLYWKGDGASDGAGDATNAFFVATFHLTISISGQRATGKIQRNNYHHKSCGPSLRSGKRV